MAITVSRYGVGIAKPEAQAKHEAIMGDDGNCYNVLSVAGAAKKTQVRASHAANKTRWSGTYANGHYTPGR